MSMRYDLYVITDETLSKGLSHAQIAERAVEGGADIIQLRDKKRCPRALLEVALEIREITEKAGVAFFVNDSVEVALASGADGVHLGQSDLPLRAARKLSHADFIIGVSAGCVEEAVQAAREGADYVALGPIFPTSSKSDAGPLCGLEMLKQTRKAVSIPLVAIGGIGLNNVADVIEAGADGVATISAIVGQDDVAKAAKDMKAVIAKAKSRER